jgi:predicted ATP-binding protein involved in virulence
VDITRVRLEKIRQFRNLDISFRRDIDGEPRSWTVLLGDNSTGKTTLMRCIALGLCDESSAAGLVRERKGGFVRRRAKEGFIYIELLDDHGNTWTIVTLLTKFPRTGERVRQRIHSKPIDFVRKMSSKELKKESATPEEFPWQSLFISAYGAGRTPDGREEYEEYRNIDAVYTLFQYEQPLQSPELAWRRMLDWARHHPRRGNSRTSERKANQRIKNMLREVLVLKDDEDVDLKPEGIRVSGPGYSVPLSSHADGYKSTTNWVLDLLSWRLLFNRGLDPKTMKGIVLVDEIEQHLHPRWQRHIITKLKDQFPCIQFIVSSHSPLCVAGAADLDDADCQLISLVREDNRIFHRVCDLPMGLRADQILTAEQYFNLSETRNPIAGNKVNRYRELFRKEKLSTAEKREYERLRTYIDSVAPEIGLIAEEYKVKRDLEELLNQLSEYDTQER